MDGESEKSASSGWADVGPPADAEALRQAQPFNIDLCSSDKRIVDLANHLYTEFIACKRAPRVSRIRDHIICVLLNLYSAYLNDPARYVRYPRDPARYTKGRYNQQPISWRKLDRVLCAFNGELLEHHNGIPGFDGFEDGRQARMRATSKMVELMLVRFNFTPGVISLEDSEVIILRGKKDDEGYAETLDYKDTAYTRQMRKSVEVINDHLSKSWIDIFLPDVELQCLNHRMGRSKDRVPINFHRKRLRRIFNNGSFSCGGRFYYGWWQEVPAEYRPYIQIDGQQTIEIDFSGMHFAMFYAQVGLTVPADPYQLPGVIPSERAIVKKALNALINASSEDEAVRAVRSEAQDIPLPKDYPRAEDLVEALKAAHAPIKYLFCTGEGLRAQFVDSKIAEKIMLYFAERGVTVLPVHDSFIVIEAETDRLHERMTQEFEEVFRQEIKTKTAIPEWEIAGEPNFAKTDLLRQDTAYAGYEARQQHWREGPGNELLKRFGIRSLLGDL